MLPDFCYICGYIGHQYSEWTKYRNHLRREMARGPRLKALDIVDKLKQNKGKEGGRIEQEKQS